MDVYEVLSYTKAMTYFIYLIIMISFIDTFSQLPIMSPFAQSLGASPFVIGVVIGMYSFTNMVGNIFAGFWIDKNGTRRVLYIGLAASGLILLAYVLVSTLTHLLIVRFFHGIIGGFLVPASFTFIANRGGKKERGRTMALSGAAVGLAAVIGPAFGGIVTSKLGIDWVFIIIGMIMIVTSIFAWWLLPTTKITRSERLNKQKGTELLDLLKIKPLFCAYLGSFALMFAQGIIGYMLPLKVEALNYGSHLSGMLLSIFGVTAIFIFILPTNRLFDRISHGYTLTIGLVIMGSGLFLLSSATAQALMFVIMILYGVGFALVFPSINALIIQHTDALINRGKAFAIFYAIFSLGVVVGSLVTGAFRISANTSFIMGAVVFFVSSIIVWRLGQSTLKDESA